MFRSKDSDEDGSDEEEEEEVLEAEGSADPGTFSRAERERAKNVFKHCAIMVIIALILLYIEYLYPSMLWNEETIKTTGVYEYNPKILL